MLFLPCTASEITTTTTPTLTPPPAAALLLLPLLLLLVLLGCCFVCTPWPANKDCGPVVVVTGGGGLNNKGKKRKKQKYTRSGTGCQIRLQASQNKTNPCMLHGAPVFVSTNNNNNNNNNNNKKRIRIAQMHSLYVMSHESIYSRYACRLLSITGSSSKGIQSLNIYLLKRQQTQLAPCRLFFE